MTNNLQSTPPGERALALWLKRLLIVLVILLPLLMLFALLRAPLTQYTPVVSSDELYYWREALTFQTVGFNAGYSTYAEQLSPIGNYYSWGIFVPIFQATVTRLFGWSLYSIPLMNAILLALALAVFIRLTKPNIERLIWLIVGLLTFYPLLIYDVTSMLEVLAYAFTVVIAALFYVIMNADAPNWKLAAAAFVVIMVAALLRPTLGLFFIPLCFLLLRRRTPRTIIAALIAGAALWAFAWAAVSLTASPYPRPLTLILSALKSNPVEALRLMLYNLTRNLALFRQGSAFEIVLRQEIIVILAILLISTLLKRLRSLRGLIRIELTPLEAGLNFYSLGLILALHLLFYDLLDRRDFRLMAPHLLFMLLLLVAYRRRAWLIGFALVGVLLLPYTTNAYLDWSLKLADPQARTSYDEWHAKLADVLGYEADAPSPWCNSVLHTAYYLSPPATSAMLLAIDSGMGISILPTFEQMSLPLKSRYLILDDGFYAQHGQALHTQPLLDVPGGKLYLNLDAAC